MSTYGVNLDLFEIDAASADAHGHLVAVALAVGAVRSGLHIVSMNGMSREITHEIVVFWTVLLEQTVGSKVCSVAAGRKDDYAVFGVLGSSASPGWVMPSLPFFQRVRTRRR